MNIPLWLVFISKQTDDKFLEKMELKMVETNLEKDILKC